MSAVTFDHNANGMMNSSLLKFLRERINTFAKWDLVRFFHDNPHAAEIAPNIAQYIGRDLPEVEQELASLVDAQVLRMRPVSAVQVYSLVDNATTRERIHEFFSACDDPEFRVQYIHEVIENSR